MKVRSYIDLSPEDERLLTEHFERLDSRDGAEIVLDSPPINFDYYLDERYYPNLKIIACRGAHKDHLRGTDDGRNIQVFQLSDDIVNDLIQKTADYTKNYGNGN